MTISRHINIKGRPYIDDCVKAVLLKYRGPLEMREVWMEVLKLRSEVAKQGVAAALSRLRDSGMAKPLRRKGVPISWVATEALREQAG